MQQEAAEIADRIDAELEFVASAYTPEEAWVERKNNKASSSVSTTVVQRRLNAVVPGGGTYSASREATFILQLQLPEGYLSSGRTLDVSGRVEGGRTSTELRKKAHDCLPGLLRACQAAAEAHPGEESIFSVFSSADEWMKEWSDGITRQRAVQNSNKSVGRESFSPKPVLAQHLIFSHHIVSQTKRSDIKHLASELHLTGYLKIGWPGIIIVEGNEANCHDFYDKIKRWSWQYLVLRGETRHELPKNATIDTHRKFDVFQETDAMSKVASHCRRVGLEALFMTSMKVYGHENGNNNRDGDFVGDQLYAALIRVDHMNDGKGYRKWLRKTCIESDVLLLIKQCYPNDDFSKRPLIIIGLVGSRDGVSTVLKKWRTSRVDIDLQGKRCLERMMTVLNEGEIDCAVDLDWEAANLESSVNTTKDKLVELINASRIDSWIQAIDDVS